MADGYLLIADISGYTAFLTGAETDHAQDIMQGLMHALVKSVRPPLVISKLEGDAVFCYTVDGAIQQGQTFVEMVEQIYFEFCSARDRMQHNTTCNCKACTLIPTLDLKFVVHHGAYALMQIGGGQELSGPDVILVHRLLKNTIKEATGFKAYAFYTDAASQTLPLGPIAEAMTPHTETYEHIGDVRGVVADLIPVWERKRAERRYPPEKYACWFSVEYDIDAPPAVVWDYVTRPENRTRWLGVKGAFNTGLVKGRLDVGATQHCDHGNTTTPFTIMDWQPFDYVTYRNPFPMTGAPVLMLTDLTPAQGGTRFRMLAVYPAPETLWQRLSQPLVWLIGSIFKSMVSDSCRRIGALIAEDIAAGKLVLPEPAPAIDVPEGRPH